MDIFRNLHKISIAPVTDAFPLDENYNWPHYVRPELLYLIIGSTRNWLVHNYFGDI